MIFSIIAAVIVFSVLIYLYLKQKARPQKRSFNTGAMDTTQLDEPTSPNNGFNLNVVQNKWNEIVNMQTAGPSGLKNALFEADKLLDYCMIGRGFEGETMGDRLKSGGQQFSNLNAVWDAHKLRNQMAHEVEHDVVAEQVKSAILALGQAIRELGVSI